MKRLLALLLALCGLTFFALILQKKPEAQQDKGWTGILMVPNGGYEIGSPIYDFKCDDQSFITALNDKRFVYRHTYCRDKDGALVVDGVRK